MPTGEVDISNNQWSSFSEEEKEELRQKQEDLLVQNTQMQVTEKVGGISKAWHDEMRLQAEHATQEDHSFDLPEGWNWIQAGTHKAGPYNPDVYEEFPWPIIWEYKKLNGSETEARNQMYQAYLDGEEIDWSDGEVLKPEFKEMEIAGAKVYAAILPNSYLGKYTTEFIAVKNGESYYFLLFDSIEKYIPEMTVVISSLN